MIILGIALLIMFTACIIWCAHTYWENMLPIVCICILGMALFITTAMGVGNYYGSSAEIAEFKTIQSTINQQRTDGISDIERATLTQTIVSANKWLAYKQFENSVWYGDTVPDEVDVLKPIK